jgi:hypothetical protein
MKLRLQLFSLLASAFLNDLLAVPSAYITLPDQYLTANGEVTAAAIPPNHWPVCACGIKIIYGAPFPIVSQKVNKIPAKQATYLES